MKQILLAGLALAALSLGTVGSADAATQETFDYGPAAANCQGALPAFAGTLRARPLAIGNEGSSNAFVSCAAGGSEGNAGKVISRFLLRVGNSSGSTATISVTCTLVHGYGGGSTPVYVSRTVSLSPGAIDQIDFYPSDISASTSFLSYPQVSCGLPPGGLVYYTGVLFTYEIGA